MKILLLYYCVYLSEIVLLSSLKSSCNSVLCYLILNVVIRAKQYIWNACMHILKVFRFKFGMYVAQLYLPRTENFMLFYDADRSRKAIEISNGKI